MSVLQFTVLLATALLSSGAAAVLSVVFLRNAMVKKANAEADKVDSEARKTDVEGDVALAQEQRAAQLETLRETRALAAEAKKDAAQARKDRELAQKAERLAQQAEATCLNEKRRVVLAFDKFINRIEDLLVMPDSDERRALYRTAISEAREAI